MLTFGPFMEGYDHVQSHYNLLMVTQTEARIEHEVQDRVNKLFTGSKTGQHGSNATDAFKETNNNIATISEVLKTTVLKLDTSAIFNVLNDKNIGISLRSSLKNINNASSNASDMTNGLNQIVIHLKQGKGAAGLLLSDTAFAGNLNMAVIKLRSASDNADKMTGQLNTMAGNINHDLAYGKGPLHALLRDSVITQKLNASMDNVQKGTDGFNQIVQALKHNFLVRGYFKTQAKKQQKDSINRQIKK